MIRDFLAMIYATKIIATLTFILRITLPDDNEGDDTTPLGHGSKMNKGRKIMCWFMMCT